MRYCTGSPRLVGVRGPGWNSWGVSASMSTRARVWLIMFRVTGLASPEKDLGVPSGAGRRLGRQQVRPGDEREPAPHGKREERRGNDPTDQEADQRADRERGQCP